MGDDSKSEENGEIKRMIMIMMMKKMGIMIVMKLTAQIMNKDDDDNGSGVGKNGIEGGVKEKDLHDANEAGDLEVVLIIMKRKMMLAVVVIMVIHDRICSDYTYLPYELHKI